MATEMATERRPVCQRCAQIKQACDGNLPCSRCTRLSLPCRPRGNGNLDGLPAAFTQDEPYQHLLDHPKEKARIKRVQTGCIMCKQRKKKCDEIKPKCGDCKRLCLECHWPPERAKERGERVAKHRAKQTQAQSQTQAQLQSQAQAQALALQQKARQEPPPAQRYEPQVTPAMINTIAASPVSTVPPATALGPVTAAGAFGQMSIRQHSPVMSSPSSTMSITQDTGLGYQPFGEVNRSTSSETRRNDSTGWQLESASPWYQALSPASSYRSFESGTPASLSTYVPQLLPHLSNPHDRALLNHYSTIVSPLLSRRSSTSANPYINYLLPMAHSNELVLHCVLALSGNHWRKLQPHMGNRGLLHQSQATQSLARLLPHVSHTSADIALVSSLLLCMTELFDGTSEGWKLHLTGAKRLLAALRRQHGDLHSGQYKFLLRLSRFLDSAATVSTCRPPLMEEEANDAAAVEGMTRAADVEDSAVYGIPKELFHLVDQINSLADKRKTRVDDASEAVFLEEASQIEERIERWSYEYGGLNRAVNQLAPADEDALYATMAFEHALRLRLHQIVKGYSLEDTKVTQNVNGILESVQKIRYGSPLEPCLLFPLVMAGGACYPLESRAIIQDRLMVMERTCGFGYVYNARDLVERVWQRREQEGPGAIVNWARIRYEEMHGLVVF